MAKYSCCVCGKSLGAFSDKAVLSDGAVCLKCLKKGGIHSLHMPGQYSTGEISKLLTERREIISKFKATNDNYYIQIDTNSHVFKIDDEYFRFEELVSYSYNEFPKRENASSNDKKTQGAAIGGAVGGLRGGAIGGAIGAAVGGTIGSLFSASCEYINISLSLSNPIKNSVKINFITEKVSTRSKEYMNAVKRSTECLEILQLISGYNSKEQERQSVAKQSTIEKIQHEKNGIRSGRSHFCNTA